jgi:hypothetical protein
MTRRTEARRAGGAILARQAAIVRHFRTLGSFQKEDIRAGAQPGLNDPLRTFAI